MLLIHVPSPDSGGFPLWALPGDRAGTGPGTGLGSGHARPDQREALALVTGRGQVHRTLPEAHSENTHV